MNRTSTKPLNWLSVPIGPYYLHTHGDLRVTDVTQTSRRIVLLGDLFDWRNPAYGNTEILQHLLASGISCESVLHELDHYCGSYVLIFHSDQDFIILTDAGSQRHIFYCQNGHSIPLCASQPNLISFLDHGTLDDSPDALSFFSSKAYRRRNCYPGRTTPFADVRHLKPNKYLDLKEGREVRFYPYNKFQKISQDDALISAGKMLQGFLGAAHARYGVRMAVTAGWDSRVILSATKKWRDEIVYFVFNKQEFSDDHPDITIPTRLFKILEVPFEVIDVPQQVDPHFMQIVRKSIRKGGGWRHRTTFYALHNFDSRINVTGDGGGVIKSSWINYQNSTPVKLAGIYGYDKFPFAVRQYEMWMNEFRNDIMPLGYPFYNYFFWEEKLPNFFGRIRDIEFFGNEVMSPFISRAFFTLMQSAPPAIRQDQYIELYVKMIRRSWPELLAIPINPHPKKRFIGLLNRLRLYHPIKSIQWALSKKQ